MVYYNEIDAYAADWLRNLIQAGELPSGDVDERSIVEVQPDDLRPYTQCHFFAGLGGWLYALRLAGWPADEPVWTGSCPCQPFSAAGDRAGTADPRHLWPAFYRLIRECRPAAVFGEQVGSALGYRWLAGVRADVEQEGYAFAAADLPAACVGAPHIRQRLWFGAVRLEHASSERLANRAQIHQGQRRQGEAPPDEPRHTHRLADAGRGGVRSGSGSPDAYEASGETESQVEKRQLSRATARDCGPDGGMAYPGRLARIKRGRKPRTRGNAAGDQRWRTRCTTWIMG